MIIKILIKLFRSYQSIVLSIKTEIAKKLFISNCIVGVNFGCTASSKCINKTKNKNNISIGNNCEILGTLVAEGNGKIKIGKYTTIRFASRILAIDQIEIGDYVIISNNVTIYDNNNHPVQPEKRIEMSKSGFYSELWYVNNSSHSPIIIHDNVWVGERATILKGVTIGTGAIVAMGAIVTKNVPEYSVVAGNPAKVVKYLK